MKTAIVNTTKRLIIIGDLILIPGANYVEPFAVKKHEKMLEDKSESGCIEMPSMEIEDDLATSTLGGYNAKDAVKLVKNTNDYDTLIKFQTEEIADKKRVTVLSALEAQITLSKDALNNSGE